jgi:hypothetical protein
MLFYFIQGVSIQSVPGRICWTLEERCLYSNSYILISAVAGIMIWNDIFVNCNWVATRWQQYSTHIHTNITENDTTQKIHRTTQKLGRARAVPRLCGFYPGICLTTEEKSRKNLSQGKKLQSGFWREMFWWMITLILLLITKYILK